MPEPVCVPLEVGVWLADMDTVRLTEKVGEGELEPVTELLSEGDTVGVVLIE